MTTIRLRNAPERLSHAVLAVVDSTASAENLIEPEHALARAIDWRPLSHAQPCATALKEARAQTEAAIAALPDAARGPRTHPPRPDLEHTPRRMTPRECELCGRRPREDLVPLQPDHEVYRSCSELIRVGRLMVEKHGLDKVRELFYEMVEKHWRDHAD